MTLIGETYLNEDGNPWNYCERLFIPDSHWWMGLIDDLAEDVYMWKDTDTVAEFTGKHLNTEHIGQVNSCLE